MLIETRTFDQNSIRVIKLSNHLLVYLSDQQYLVFKNLSTLFKKLAYDLHKKQQHTYRRTFSSTYFFGFRDLTTDISVQNSQYIVYVRKLGIIQPDRSNY